MPLVRADCWYFCHFLASDLVGPASRLAELVTRADPEVGRLALLVTPLVATRARAALARGEPVLTGLGVAGLRADRVRLLVTRALRRREEGVGMIILRR